MVRSCGTTGKDSRKIAERNGRNEVWESNLSTSHLSRMARALHAPWSVATAGFFSILLDVRCPAQILYLPSRFE